MILTLMKLWTAINLNYPFFLTHFLWIGLDNNLCSNQNIQLVMVLLQKFCPLTTFLSNQLHLSKLNGVLSLVTSDLSPNHPNFPCPFCTEIFDIKAEVIQHLDICDGTEDLSAMIPLSVMRKLRTILSTATSLMIPLCSFCSKIFKEK